MNEAGETVTRPGQSQYPFEVRLKSLKNEVPLIEEALIEPDFNDSTIKAKFFVPLRSARFYLSYQTTKEIYNEWFNGSEQTPEDEKSERETAAKLILRIGQQLQVSQKCIDTSIVLMHRFYIFHPVQMFPHEVTAAAALLLGCKSLNETRLSKTIAEAVKSVNSSQSADKTVENFKEELIETEVFMAMTLGTCFDVILPHEYITNMTSSFNIFNRNSSVKTQVDRFASATLLKTAFCIKYPPSLVAAFAVYIASLHAKTLLVPSKIEGHPWYYYFDGNITQEMIHALKNEYLENCHASTSSKNPRKVEQNRTKAFAALGSAVKRAQSDNSDYVSASKFRKISTSDVEKPHREKFECERPQATKRAYSDAFCQWDVDFIRNNLKVVESVSCLGQVNEEDRPREISQMESRNISKAQAMQRETVIKPPRRNLKITQTIADRIPKIDSKPDVPLKAQSHLLLPNGVIPKSPTQTAVEVNTSILASEKSKPRGIMHSSAIPSAFASVTGSWNRLDPKPKKTLYNGVNSVEQPTKASIRTQTMIPVSMLPPSKGIKSSVPLRIKPPKKSELQSVISSVEMVENESEPYVEVKPLKQRKAHGLKSMPTDDRHEQKEVNEERYELDIHHVVSEEILNGTQAPTTVQLSKFLEASISNPAINAPNNDRKRKRHKKQNHRDKKKLKLETDHGQNVANPPTTSLKLVLQKVMMSDGAEIFKVKNS